MILLHSKVYGIVQGVGFRPFIARLAQKYAVNGSVCNKGPYVELYIAGAESDCRALLDEMESQPPERATILKVDTDALTPTDDGYQTFTDFQIIDSARERGAIFVSPDIATCDKCRAELYDPHNRRYLHPFINCTACGPRLTILEAMPYDRERTSMREFPMCEACHTEYTTPSDRRYDAQPVCCNDCGPEVYLLDGSLRGGAAITAIRQAIIDGQIVAIKGIGGFHLACDASNDAAVRLLRQRKNRPFKPFALMMRDMAAVRRECRIEPGQEALLTGHQKPILLLHRRDSLSPDTGISSRRLADSVAPGNPRIGVMLPYAPVQMLLFDYPDGLNDRMPDMLVMTSGNPHGAPICRDDEQVRSVLAGRIADMVLSHNRRIRLRADDTVTDWYRGVPYMIRRSRGFAPLPVMLSGEWHGQVLGIGGELKNTFCLGHDDLLYPSPYVGDMSDLRTVQALKESIHLMAELLEIKPELIACDLHPGYITTQVAESLELPLIKVQHHYAHILSCMAENDYPVEAESVIGLSLDGTGYGLDSTIWGGEILLCNYSGFQRLGHITPFPQAGGDKASREGWRIAAAQIYALTADREQAADIIKKLALTDEQGCRAIAFMLDKNLNTITSTSMGRLFDSISAVLGIRRSSTFEGEAANYLEFAAEEYLQQQGHAPDDYGEPWEPPSLPDWLPAAADSAPGTDLPTDKLFRYILERQLTGCPAGESAYIFHYALARMLTAAAAAASQSTGSHTVALSGGVWQNHLLLQLTEPMLTAAGLKVLRHSQIPPNDGGICLGQAVAALCRRNGIR